MISIVCVANDYQILDINLRKSLSNQNREFELIIVDNRNRTFHSLPSALNFGAKYANGKYIMFIHQDVSLLGDSWLERAENILDRLDQFGAAGVAGVTEKNEYKGFLYNSGVLWGSPIKGAVPVQTLDEQLMIVPRDLFETLKFDERFKFHSYCADYCLSLKERGLNVYVLPLMVKHNSLITPIRRAGSIRQDDMILKVKHPQVKHVYKTTGKVRSYVEVRYDRFRRMIGGIVRKILYDQRHALPPDASSMLDVGTVGHEQPWLQGLGFSGYSVGVSEEPSQILISKKLKIHGDYVLASMVNLPFQDRSFHVGLAVSLFEYMKAAKAVKCLDEAERICAKMIVKVPNTCCPRGQTRIYTSTWTSPKLKRLGYEVRALDFSRLGRSRLRKIFACCCAILGKPFNLTFYSSQLLAVKRTSSKIRH